MKNLFVKGALYLAGLIALIVGTVMFINSGSSNSATDDGEVLRSRKIVSKEPAKKRLAVRKKVRVGNAGAAEERRAAVKPRLPEFDLDDRDTFTEQQRQLLADIRAALDNDDKPRMIALIQKMQKLDEWPDGIPRSLKKLAIETMAWLGADCLPELAVFFADQDPEIVEDVVSQYEDALSNPELTSDQIAQLLVIASQFVHDADAMDSMLTSLNELNHEQAVKTIKQIMVVGTDETKQVLPDNIDFYTGEENLHTPEALDDWLQKNPDTTDDEVLQ